MKSYEMDMSLNGTVDAPTARRAVDKVFAGAETIVSAGFGLDKEGRNYFMYNVGFHGFKITVKIWEKQPSGDQYRQAA